MRLSVLSVAYPFAPVQADPVGGAEKILYELDRALVAAGHRSIVIAPAGSQVSGLLHEIPRHGVLEPPTRELVHAAVQARIRAVLNSESPDVIHLHGPDFAAYLPPPGIPLLVTLHLPARLYPAAALAPLRPNTYLVPVSATQARDLQGGHVLEPIGNGVEIPEPRAHARRNYLLALGRICPEKGFHEALDAAARANLPLLLAGRVFGYPEHERYFHEQIVPRLDRARRWIGSVAGARKRRLLAAARCVLVPSRIAASSSLVAMEALAAGTPVIAYRVGALPEIVEDGVTGFVVDDVPSMARAIGAVERIDSERCRRAARERFSLERTTSAYLQLYQRLVQQRARCALSVDRDAASRASACSTAPR